MVLARCTRRAAFLISLILLTAIAQKAVADPLALEVSEASATVDLRTKEPIVSIKMTAASARAFAIFTQENIGRKIEVRLEGKVLTAPVIREPIIGGSLILGDRFTADEVRRIVERLYRGSIIEIALAAN